VTRPPELERGGGFNIYFWLLAFMHHVIFCVIYMVIYIYMQLGVVLYALFFFFFFFFYDPRLL
jgi:hypothetical protein